MLETLEFKEIVDAVRYLTAKGWQLSLKSLYRHIGQGKLAPKPWTSEQLDAYAAEHLRPAITGATAPAGSRLAKGAAAELLAARKQKLEIESEIKALELKKAKGELVEVWIFAEALARRALRYKNSLINWFPRNLLEIIAILEGNSTRAPDVIDLWLRFIDELLSEYTANPRLDVSHDAGMEGQRREEAE